MFGFLKQKISDFGNKLKKTVETEENKQPKEKPAAKTEEKIAKKETEHKKEEIKAEETKQVEEKKPEPKKETPSEEKKEHKPEEKTAEKKEEKKTGLFGKLFGGKKTEEKKAEHKKEERHKAGEEKKKKTKEELAEEMEKKMFAQIEEEMKKEGIEPAKEEIVEEAEEEIEEEKKEIPVKKDELHAEKIQKDVDEKKEIEKKREEKTTLEKAVHVEEKFEKKQVLDEIEEELAEKDEEVKEIKAQMEPEVIREKSREIEIKTLEEDKRELKAKVGVTGGLKGFLFGGIEITEKQIEDLLFELELSLIEGDVEQDAASELVKQIKKRLIGTKVSSKGLDEYLKEQIKEILSEMMQTKKINLLEEMKGKKPFKILMLGPNGAGKTTSIAKLVHYFKKHGKSSIVAAADTFRAGAIDQLEEHAKRLGVRVIKQQYGADPAAVAFDAIKAAEAAKIDVVIIDSAGRQETNKNLMEELRKIERVAKPDMKIYVGEAYVGQTLLEQVKEFEEIVGLDGFILTKIDTDAKGGTAISLLYKLKKPIIFVGTGQGYDDFKEFTPEFILERII
ncbi:Signal recognition particle receptor FtsY [uncultured archaeon]|nr:Signal recognition particle receptor FtsY [uncultured archaeon]